MTTTTEALEIRKVKIGDQFINPINRKSGRISTVIDFTEKRSMTSGKVIDQEVVSQHEFMGQIMTTVTSFTTVLRNRV